MSEYQPIDISSYCSAGAEVLNASQQLLVGEQTFHGLPFLIGAKDGDGSGNCFAAFDGASEELTIPISQTARTVLVAHALLDSDLLTGGAMGKVVAEYLFHFQDGEEACVPIRERFEIGVVPCGWGQWTFHCVPDQKNTIQPRYEGQWGMSGFRQTESNQGSPHAYYLWAWENPRPDAVIQSLKIVPTGHRFLIAGITLGHVKENPFVRQGKRETRITLTRPEDAEKPFSLDVEVNRGVANYVHPLPEASPDQFMNDAHKGWGEAQNLKSSPAYVEIAAVPSATVTVKQADEELSKMKWGEVEEKEAVETDRVRIELLDRGRNWVHVTVLDEETGKPVPCRVHFRSPEGIPYQPHGHHNQVNSNLGTWHTDIGGDVRLGQITYAYIDGTCQGWLPRGEVIVDVARGYEYEPLRSKVEIQAGQRELTLRLKRWTDMNSQGWYSGDSHVHFLSTQGSLTESQGEEVNVVNLLQSQWGSLFTNTEEFTGGPQVSLNGKHIVYASQENRQHILGHLTLWGLKKPVMPWCTDGPSEAELGGTLEVTMSHWADQCHAQGGTVIIPHLPNPNGEPATLIATGRADAIEMLMYAEYYHIEYYRYLNCGYRLPLVGGTDKMSSDVPVGINRTYACLSDDEEFNYDNWTKAVRSGRTFLSSGPIIHLSVDGHAIGDTVQLSGAGTVEVEAWAESIFPIHTLEIVQQGRVVASTGDAKGTRKLALREKIKVDGHTWLAARCAGPNYTAVPHHDAWRRGIFAHTSPVYVACGGDWGLFDKEVAQYMLTLIDGNLTYLREMSPQHKHETVTHHHGEDDHAAFIERPFLQAIEAIHQRMHKLGIQH